MSTLADLATQALQPLQVQWLPLRMFAGYGTTFNVGDYATGVLRVTNTTGLPLRNVAIDVAMIGTAARFTPSYEWDGHSNYIPELEIGAVWESYVALLQGVSAGSFSMTANITAEVIPLGVAPPRTAAFVVYPAP